MSIAFDIFILYLSNQIDNNGKFIRISKQYFTNRDQ